MTGQGDGHRLIPIKEQGRGLREGGEGRVWSRSSGTAGKATGGGGPARIRSRSRTLLVSRSFGRKSFGDLGISYGENQIREQRDEYIEESEKEIRLERNR